MTGGYPDGVTDADIEREMDAGEAPRECGHCLRYVSTGGGEVGVCAEEWERLRGLGGVERAVRSMTDGGRECWTGLFELDRETW